jgi:hypothetical protein
MNNAKRENEIAKIRGDALLLTGILEFVSTQSIGFNEKIQNDLTDIVDKYKFHPGDSDSDPVFSNAVVEYRRDIKVNKELQDRAKFLLRRFYNYVV